MKAQGSAKVSSSGGYSIVPPPNFSYVEENICRCTYPVTRANISFAQSINIGYIVNVSARKIDPAFQTYCDERTIEINNILQEGDSPPFNQVAALESWICTVISLIAEKAASLVVLVVGSADSYYDCLVLSCLRRLQAWSYVSIFAEFRHFTWPHKLFDFEQIIEIFHCANVTRTKQLEELLAIHENFKEEELKLLERCKHLPEVFPGPLPLPPAAAATADVPTPDASDPPTPTPTSSALPPLPTAPLSEAEEQMRIDAILHKLFFSPPNTILSEDITYDAALSLINDKDEED